MKETEPVARLKGVGPKKASVFAAAGIETVGELIRYLPSRYDKYEPPGKMADFTDGCVAAVCGFLEKPLTIWRSGSRLVTRGTVRAGNERVPAAWFNMPYLRRSLKPGKMYVFRGKVWQKDNRKTLIQPGVFLPEEYDEKCRRLQPIYPLTGGLTEKLLQKTIQQALENVEWAADPIRDEVRNKCGLMTEREALLQIHFPTGMDTMLRARDRLVFDELLLFTSVLRSAREKRVSVRMKTVIRPSDWIETALASLPFSLTNAQMRTWREIEKDMVSGYVMSRLIQGDVGSGKTILAYLAALLACANGGQCAVMAPTELLSLQHYKGFELMVEKTGLPVRFHLLTGSMSNSQKSRIREQIAAKDPCVVFGTHALIQDSVSFPSLMLVVTDEQHRFGVKQRQSLSGKGEAVHILALSATPIPRTLHAVLFGDMDVSVIDETPKSRLPVKSCVVSRAWRANAWRLIEKQAAMGLLSYVVCPLVEPGELSGAENVTEYAEKLCEGLGNELTVGILHGKMKSTEKEDVMTRFQKGEIQVLVSTTVIEVGVDVPEASVMIIENAERFGLAQLHQLRGRVGRGSAQSYCVFICGNDDEKSKHRLDVLCASMDGFEIARKDLELRGPGDLLGVRQSGEAMFVLADINRDGDILEAAGREAERMYTYQKDDPDPSNAEFARRLENYRHRCNASD